MQQRKRGAGGFRAESRVTAVTRRAALRADGRSCKPVSPTELGSLGHALQHGLTSQQYDKTKVFGSKEAPASFDSLPETIVNIVCTLHKIPKMNVQRQLDDVPMVASKESKLTEKFTTAYKDVCEKLNIPLAPSTSRGIQISEA
jgi:hypothetical protein